MDNSLDIINATAGLAKVTDEINKYGLAGDYQVGLATKTFEDSLLRQEAFDRDVFTLGSSSAVAKALSMYDNITQQFEAKAVNVCPAMR